MDYTKVNLHYLRAYASDIGVKSPTSYRKNELIIKIKEVESGLVKPYFSKTGRPKGQNLSVEDIKKERKVEIKNGGERKDVLLYAIGRFKRFLDDLEKEIKDKY